MNPVIYLSDLIPKDIPRHPSREQIIASDPFAVPDPIHGQPEQQNDFDVPIINERKRSNE